MKRFCFALALTPCFASPAHAVDGYSQLVAGDSLVLVDEAVVDLALAESIVDEISADSSIAEVTAELQPERGHEHRMRLKAGGILGPWSSWTTSRLAFAISVPDAGQETTVDVLVETRPRAGTSTIAVHGYIKIKKLNSGG